MRFWKNGNIFVNFLRKKSRGRKSVVYEITPIRTNWTNCQKYDEASNGAGSGVWTKLDKLNISLDKIKASNNIVQLSNLSKEIQVDIVREGEV